MTQHLSVTRFPQQQKGTIGLSVHSRWTALVFPHWLQQVKAHPLQDSQGEEELVLQRLMGCVVISRHLGLILLVQSSRFSD